MCIEIINGEKADVLELVKDAMYIPESSEHYGIPDFWVVRIRRENGSELMVAIPRKIISAYDGKETIWHYREDPECIRTLKQSQQKLIAEV